MPRQLTAAQVLKITDTDPRLKAKAALAVFVNETILAIDRKITAATEPEGIKNSTRSVLHTALREEYEHLADELQIPEWLIEEEFVKAIVNEYAGNPRRFTVTVLADASGPRFDVSWAPQTA